MDSRRRAILAAGLGMCAGNIFSQSSVSLPKIGLGTWQSDRDEVTYICQTLERCTRSNGELQDSVDKLCLTADSIADALEEIRDLLRKQEDRKLGR